MKLTLPIHYIYWHYINAPEAILKKISVSVLFIYNFFSIPILLKTFFSPWKRLSEDYGKGFDIENFFSTIIVNILMRVVGVFIRLITIIIFFIIFILTLVSGLLFLFFWLISPIALPIMFLWGLGSLLTYGF